MLFWAILAALGILWLWRKGYLGANNGAQVLALVGGMLSTLLFLRGQPALGMLVGVGVGLLSFKDNIKAKLRTTIAKLPIDELEARRVLGVGVHATRSEILAAHRRKIAEVHPDKNPGATADMASRVNAARDYLLKKLPDDSV